MLIPVRCFTCGKVIGNKFQEFIEGTRKDTAENTMNKLGLRRMCCRRMVLCNVELIDNLLKYNK